MIQVHELARVLKTLEDEMICCMKCGMCQAVCPLYAETGRETDVARGKIALVDNLSQEILNDPKAVKERLDCCLLCGSCAANCPSGVKIMEIFLKARVIITGYLGLSPLKKAVFRGLLAHPGLFDGLLQAAAALQAPFTRQVNHTLGSSCARIISPRIMSKLIGGRHFKPLAGKAWHKNNQRQLSSLKDAKIKMAFYPGCLVDKIFPNIADSVIKITDYYDVDVFVPGQVPCCGIPALSSGDMATFKKLVQKNINLFDARSFDYLVTPCATCTSTIKKIWPMMADYFDGLTVKKIHRLAEKTMDINDFLINVLNVAPIGNATGPDTRVTYHDPCHLSKSLGIVEAPRSLIQKSGNHELVPMTDADQCCGMGGSFNLEHYETSNKIGQKKIENIAATEAEILATGCPACMLQMIDLLSRAGCDIPVRHPVELYADNL